MRKQIRFLCAVLGVLLLVLCLVACDGGNAAPDGSGDGSNTSDGSTPGGSEDDGGETHEHSFTVQNIDAAYLKSAATVSSPAEYYYSCSCGEKGAKTFTVGNPLPGGSEDGESTPDGTVHTHVYNRQNIADPYRKSEATCTQAAVYYYSCACGAKGTATFESGSLKAHTYDRQNTAVAYRKSEATCTNAAVYYYSCACGAKGSETFESGSIKAHIYDKQSTAPSYLASIATETAPAMYYYSCACGARGSKTFPVGKPIEGGSGNTGGDAPHVHIYDVKNATAVYLKNEATCTKAAVYYYSCACGEKGNVTFESGGLKAHTYDKQNTAVTYRKSEATCTNAAVYYYSCACGAKGSATFESGTPKAHTYNQQNTAVTYRKSEATCAKAAVYYYSCVCGAKGSTTFESGNALGHSWNAENTCSRCGEYRDTGLVFTKNTDNTTYTVSRYSGSAFHVAIPSTYKGGRVTAIASYAFKDCYSITSVDIPSTVVSIGSYAFENCVSLAELTLPEGVRLVGHYAFKNCADLKKITLANSITSVDYGAFYDCKGVEEVIGPMDAIADIPQAKLKKVTVTDGDAIPAEAFKECSSLQSVTIPDGVMSIGNSAFSGCTGLSSITIPSSVTSIKAHAFSGCTGLSSITIPSSVTSIKAHAFSGCTGLVSITVPDSVTSIGESAFQKCTGLTSITIPFVGASKSGTEDTHFGYIFGAYNYSFNDDYVPASLKSVAINGGSIASCAFSGCTGLTSLTIGNGVTSIEARAFEDCTGLASITVTSGNQTYHGVGNCIIESASKTLVVGCKSSVIPSDEGVTSIGQYAFSGCTGLVSITVPDSVTSIGKSAFQKCTGLTSMTLPFVGASKSGTEDTYFGYIFGGSTYYTNGTDVPQTLKTVVITGGTSIGQYAFMSCKGLTSIVVPDSVKSIGQYAFLDCTGLTSATVGNGVTSIGRGAFSGCTRLSSIIIGRGVTSIGEGVFMKCTRLTSIKYRGSSSEWSRISKGSTWNDNTGNYTVTYNYTGE